jgi:hypothetical protein
MEGIRGGLSCIMRRYVKANNKYMINYYPDKETIYLIPVDANNLYGYAMQFKLPYRGFKWCNEDELDYLFDSFQNEKRLTSNTKGIECNNNILNIDDESDVGYTLKVDLDYPKELHDKHNDYPFFAIHKDIKYDDLSPYQKRLIDKKNHKSRKLISSI